VRNVINEVCHQCCEKHLKQQKSDPNVDIHAAKENLEEELQYNWIKIFTISIFTLL